MNVRSQNLKPTVTASLKLGLAVCLLPLVVGCSKEPPSCSSPETSKLVKDILREQMAPDGFKSTAPALFDEKVKITLPAPTKLDKDIALLECSATLEVDGTSGLGDRAKGALQKFPALLINAAAEDLTNHIYRVRIKYSSQVVDGKHQVSVSGLNAIQAFLIAGLVAAHGPDKRPDPVPTPASSAQAPARWEGGLCNGLSMDIDQQAQGCHARLKERLASAEYEMRDVVASVSDKLTAERRSELDAEQTIWRADFFECSKLVVAGTQEPQEIARTRCAQESIDKRIEELKSVAAKN